jgi:hypothetical protein
MADISLVIDVKQNGVTSAVKNTKALERNVKLLSDSFKGGGLSQRQYYKGLLELARASGKSESELRKYANELRRAERASAAAAAQARLEAQARRDAAAAARVAAAAQRAATQAAAEAARAARTQADANRRLRMEFREGYAAQVALRAAQMRLNQARRQGIVTEEEYQRQLARLNEINRGNVRGTNNLGVAMQQTGYQVGDFAIQVQGGTNIAVAFGQQATQLVGVLYLLPPAMLATRVAVLGLSVSVVALIAAFSIILPIVTGVVAYFMRARESAKDAAGGIETLEDRLKSAKNATSSLSAEIERLNMGFKDTAEQSFSDAVKETADAILEIQDKLDTLFDDGPKRGSSNVAREYREEIAALNELLSARRIDLETYIQTRAELARIKELEEGRIASVKLFFDYAQRDLELAKERSEAVDAIRAAVDGELKSLGDQIALNNEILKFGKDSVEVATLRAAQEREAYKQQQLSNGILGNNLALVMDEYDAYVQTQSAVEALNSGLGDSVDLLTTAERMASRLASALDAAANAGTSRQRQIAVVQAQIEAATRGASTEVAGVRAGTEFDVGQASSDPLISGAAGAIAAAEAAELERLNNRLKELTSTPSGGSSGTTSIKDPLPELLKRLALDERLLGVSEERAAVERAIADSDVTYSKDSIDAAVKRLEVYNLEKQALEEVAATQEKIANTIENSMENAFMSMVDGTKSAKDAFKSMAADIIKELYRVLVVQQMVGSFKTGGGGILGSLAPIFGRASGGTVMSNTPYLVGEKGPEVIVPQNRGHVMNADLTAKAMGNGGGAVTVVQNFNFSANGDDSVKRIIAQAAPQIAQMTKKSIIDDRRRGGQMKATFG